MTPSGEVGYFEIRVRGREDDYPTLLNISSFLYDFNLIYEFARLATDPKYATYTFSRFSWNRDGRPLVEDDRLRVIALRQESPIELVAVVAAVPASVAALWGLVQIIEKITNWPLNREILRLQRDKLKNELNTQAANTSAALDDETFRNHLRLREATYYYDRTRERLVESSIRIIDFDVRRVPRLPNRGTRLDGGPIE
jgi:hypothetical protein